MLRLFLIFLFLSTPLVNVLAQDEELVYPQLPINEITGEIKYLEVIQEPGDVIELYQRAMNWFEIYYNPKSVSTYKKPRYQNPTTIVQVKDPIKGLLIGNAAFKIYIKSSGVKATLPAPKGRRPKKPTTDQPGDSATANKPVAAQKPAPAAPKQAAAAGPEEGVSDKTYAGSVNYTIKIQFKEGRYKYEIYDINWVKNSYFGIEQWLNENAPNQKEYIGYLNQTDAFFNSLLEDLMEGMQKSTEIPDEDDW